MKRIAIAFLLPIAVMLLASGCAREPLRGSTIRMDVPDGMAAYREAIYDGCQGLKDEGATCAFEHSDMAIKFSFRAECTGNLGLTRQLGERDSGGGAIRLAASCKPIEDLPAIVLHELMHWIGVDHLGSGTLMSPHFGDMAHSLTPDDHAALVDLGVAE